MRSMTMCPSLRNGFILYLLSGAIGPRLTFSERPHIYVLDRAGAGDKTVAIRGRVWGSIEADGGAAFPEKGRSFVESTPKFCRPGVVAGLVERARGRCDEPAMDVGTSGGRPLSMG